MQTPAPPLEAGSSVDGRYHVEDVLGRGGMSVVYRVRHATLGSIHALKVMHGTDSVAHERLMREGRVQAGLDHPNVLRVTDVVRLEHSTGLILEYVRGCNLDEAIRDGLLRTWEEKDQIGRAILRGVKAAHAEGWLHRDLKPSNVLLAHRDDGWIVKVADFGLVRSTSGTASLTGEGAVVGTPAYMAPEQLFDAPMDERVDIFALGAVLYELVTGHRAFVGGTFEAAESIRSGRFRPPREWAPDLPDRMEAAIRRALVVHPDQRASSCDVLLELWTGQRAPAVDATPTFELSGLHVPASLEPSLEQPAASPPAARSGRIRTAMGLGAAALLVGFGIWAAGPTADLPSAVVEPRVAEAPPPLPVVSPAPPAPVVVVPEPAAPISPRPAARAKPPPPVSPPLGRVVVTGTATSVSLVGPDGRTWSGGEVPAGKYSLRASFGPDGEQAFGEIDLDAGRSIHVDCDLRFTNCTVR